MTPSSISDRKIFLALFYLQVTQMLPTKCGVSWLFGSGEAKIKYFSWQPWWRRSKKKILKMATSLDFRSEQLKRFFVFFLPTSHPDAFYQVSSQLFASSIFGIFTGQIASVALELLFESVNGWTHGRTSDKKWTLYLILSTVQVRKKSPLQRFDSDF